MVMSRAWGKILFLYFTEKSHTLNDKKKKFNKKTNKKRCKVFKVMCSILP